jgi:hypothetical protein
MTMQAAMKQRTLIDPSTHADFRSMSGATPRTDGEAVDILRRVLPAYSKRKVAATKHERRRVHPAAAAIVRLEEGYFAFFCFC